MTSPVSPLAGKPPPKSLLIDVGRLLAAYVDARPDPAVPAQRVRFGTSGHRGSSLARSFNEWHVLAITQAICEYRRQADIDGPLYVGIDTHALSQPAFASALEVLAGNGIDTRISQGGEFTPTPAVSWAILAHNRGRRTGLADGIVITPSHNPPDSGGFKYNPPHGGPAEKDVTRWIEARANGHLANGLKDVARLPLAQARHAATIREFDFLAGYVADLGSVLDFDVIRAAGIRMGVNPLGGAGVRYWGAIARHYRLDLTVVSEEVDPTFAFMTVDWDGRIRMDPSSAPAMQELIVLKDRFDVAFACDSDHDRHGIVTPTGGLMPSNNYIAVAVDYLFRNRPQWRADAAVGKSVVSTAMIDRVAGGLGRRLYEVPVGFKWFVPGLHDGSLGFGGEDSAGATFCRRDGSVWTTDKDGIVAALLSAEILARTGRNPAQRYGELVTGFGDPVWDLVAAPATSGQKHRLRTLAPQAVGSKQLAGERIEQVLDRAPGNGAPIDGIKVVTASGWFVARPSGTEDFYKIYAESFRGEAHLREIQADAQAIVDGALAAG